ncbi:MULTISPECIES: hypothetical protein [unclassified Geodermatophilus]|uniref:hypothetical protein n=1 Tax=unclassified Geodermatophilus TaxID=2637632 RepID=UPI003EEC5B55
MSAEVATSSFLGEPQPVEVFHAGVWFPGELLGWRFDETGTCRVRVRCIVGGLRHTAWTYLTHLRLPEPRPVPAPSVEVPTPARPAGDPGPHLLLPPRDRHPLGAPLPRPRRAGLVEWLGTV